MSTSNNDMHTHTNKTNSNENTLLQKRIALSDFITSLYEKHSLITKQAIYMNQKRIMYTKGKDFVAFFKENYQMISQHIKDITSTNLGAEPNDKSIQTFFTICLENKLIFKLCRMEGDKAKYPKRLVPPKRNEDIFQFDEKDFYWLNTIAKETSKKTIVLLFIAVLSVLLFCLFPVWPIKVKIGFLWTILGVLLILLALTLISLVVAIVGVIFGYDIMLLPNLLEPKVSLKDRFINPFIAYYPREDPLWMVMVRVNMGLAIVIVAVLAYFHPGFIVSTYELVTSGGGKLYKLLTDKLITPANRTSVTVRDKHQRILDDIL
jgi:hypothetical protein